MNCWVTPAEMAAFDSRTASAGTPPEILMERAGQAVADTALRMLGGSRGPVVVFCGPGNNGGDGFVAARLLRSRGVDVKAVLASDSPSGIGHLCMRNLVRYRDEGGDIASLEQLRGLPEGTALGMDALLGTGFHGQAGGAVAACLGLLARCPRILAVDTPTGVDGSSGDADPLTVPASVTVTLAAPKLGLLVPPGCGFAGAVFTADIGVETDDRMDRMVLDYEGAARLLPPRPVDSHKGTFGRVMLLGGSEDMPGAALLMAAGALRAGSGLVRLFVPYPAAPLVAGRIPEVICGYFLPGDVTSLPDPSGFSCLAIGPGMGRGPDTGKIVRHVLSNWHIPAVVDADALNVLSGSIGELALRKGPLVLTPHAGELLRLAERGDGSREDLWEMAGVLSKATGATILLKGRPSVVFGPDGRRMLVPVGNSGLATGGSGDVLTGIVASLLGQGLAPFEAAALGAFLLGSAADIAAARSSARSLLPSDVADTLGTVYSFLESGPPAGLSRLEGRWNGRLWDIP